MKTTTIKEEIQEKIKQINQAIEINESLDLNTENLYRIKREYEEQLLEVEEPDKVEEDKEMSPFCGTTARNISDCIEACEEKAMDSNSHMGTCDGCKLRCLFVRNHKGSFVIKYPTMEVWVSTR